MQKIGACLVALAAAAYSSASLAQSCNTADRSVLLILDASGSMNAKLPNGETRMAVAQRAIKGVAGFVPAQAQLSLRMYGAQSAARQKNCQDTHLAVPFGPASAVIRLGFTAKVSPRSTGSRPKRLVRSVAATAARGHSRGGRDVSCGGTARASAAVTRRSSASEGEHRPGAPE